MPFNVLRCHECKTFQIHPQTKALKWRCKMCNEKQSFLKVFMTGTAPECRQTVQELNMRQGEMEDSLGMTGAELQPRNTHMGFCPARSEQVCETDTVARYSGLLKPPLSSTDNQTWFKSSTHSKEENTSAEYVDRTSSSRSEVRSWKKPPVLQAAGNHQGDRAAGSRWSKYLDPADVAESSSDEDEDQSSGTVRHPSVDSRHRGVHAMHSRQFSFQRSTELDENSSDEENLSALGFMHPRLHPMGPSTG
ncbi:uncharacterized protein LOC143290841 [Babylonia areolata]|uniref:uncharacterized protein LOC143290841 n=1 Tax=Babylonia areolata TaxID=304850 RepID=UPI003FD3B4ED